MEKINHYETLGVSPEATQDEIKKAYRAKSKEHHPDKGGDEERFKEIQKAYDILKDETSRAIYDNSESRNDNTSEIIRLFVDVLLPELVDNINTGHTMRIIVEHQINIQKKMLENEKDRWVWTKDSLEKIVLQMDAEKASGTAKTIIEQYKMKIAECESNLESIWNKLEILNSASIISKKIFK